MRSQAEIYAIILIAIITVSLLELAALALRRAGFTQNALGNEALRKAEQLYVKQWLCLRSSISTVAVLVLAYSSTSVRAVAYNASLNPDTWTCVSIEPRLRVAVLTIYGNLFTVDPFLKVYKY